MSNKNSKRPKYDHINLIRKNRTVEHKNPGYLLFSVLKLEAKMK